MLVTGDQLLAHAFGDYVIQSDWAANEKTKRSVAALVHVVTYALPFLLLGPSLLALAFIVSTHFVIDRWRLARYVCWAKNWLSPWWVRTEFPVEQGGVCKRVWAPPWKDCVGTGYAAARPPFMAVWLMIVCDNCFHVLCNGVALRWL